MEISEYGNKDSRTVLIQMIDEQDIEGLEKEYALIRKMIDRDFLLRGFRVKSWNDDLSPWSAPAVFGKEGFGNGAKQTLEEVLESCKDRTKTYYMGGYSLAGLFALWSAYQTDVFAGVAAASPSVWFPGFIDHMKEREIKTGIVYLSLGNREAKTRNPIMATVEERIRQAYACLSEKGVKCTFELNEGNHFKDPDIRMAKAFAWVVGAKGDASVLAPPLV